MSKRNKIIYWIATGWLSLGMVSTGVVQLMHTKEEIDLMNHLGYPVYFLTILGIWKLLGTIAVLVPKFPVLERMGLRRILLRDVGSDIFAHRRWWSGDGYVWTGIACSTYGCIRGISGRRIGE